MMSATQQCNLYIRYGVLGRNDPALVAERSRTRGGTTAIGADVKRIDKGRIDSWAYRP